MSSTARIPALDGFRAFSIMLVLVGHLQGTVGFGRLPLWSFFGDLAHLGVQIFFVISGLLTTSLLLEEQERTGTLSLKRFYIRRSLRIFRRSSSSLARYSARRLSVGSACPRWM